MPAPAPTNVNYTTMTRGWAARGFRPIPVFVAVIFMLILPIGLFAGAFSNAQGCPLSCACHVLAGASHQLSIILLWPLLLLAPHRRPAVWDTPSFQVSAPPL